MNVACFYANEVLLLILYKTKQQYVQLWSAGKCHVWRKKTRLKRRIATRSGKGNQPLNIKTAVERLILKLGLPKFRWSYYFIFLHVAFLLFICIFMTSHMSLFSASPTFSFFSYDTVRANNLTKYLHNVERMRYVLR